MALLRGCESLAGNCQKYGRTGANSGRVQPNTSREETLERVSRPADAACPFVCLLRGVRSAAARAGVSAQPDGLERARANHELRWSGELHRNLD